VETIRSEGLIISVFCVAYMDIAKGRKEEAEAL
jgi:hypothetical protein